MMGTSQTMSQPGQRLQASAAITALRIGCHATTCAARKQGMQFP